MRSSARLVSGSEEKRLETHTVWVWHGWMVVFRSATYLDLSEAWICSPLGQGLAQSTPVANLSKRSRVRKWLCEQRLPTRNSGNRGYTVVNPWMHGPHPNTWADLLDSIYKSLLDPHGPMPDQEQTKIYIGPLSSPTRHHHLHHLSSVSCGERLSLTFYIHIDRQRRLLRREVTQVQLDIRLGRLKPSQFDDPAARYRSIIDWCKDYFNDLCVYPLLYFPRRYLIRRSLFV